MANTVIALKKSATPSSVPSNLANGELAINYADGKLYYKAANGTIASISGNEPNYFGSVNANNTLVVADTPGDVFTLASGNNIAITGDAVNDKITIGLTNDVNLPGTLTLGAVGGDEGGELKLANALTNSVLSGKVIIDIYQNQLRFYEESGTNRGAYINLAVASTGVGSDLLAGSSGTDTIARQWATGAFDKANNAYAQANAAYNAANNAVTDFSPAFIQANTARVHANAAFASANASQTTASGAFDKANTANITADRAWNHANAAFVTSNNALPKTGGTITGNVYLSGGANSISLTNGTSNWIYWIESGATAPTFTTRSVGTKLVLYPALNDVQADYAFGIEPATLWSSVPVSSDSFGFRWYGGTTEAAFLSGSGNLTLTGSANASNLLVNGNMVFTAANDGAGSNLDADFLDGQHGSYYGIAIDVTAANRVANAAFLHANSGYAFANSIAITANLAFAHANSAYANGNVVIQTAQSAFTLANISYAHANAAFSAANVAGNEAEAAFLRANLSHAHANAAFAHANAAFLSSNSVNTYSNGTYVKLSAPSQTITGNVNIVGDFTLSGNTFAIDVTRLEVDDPLLYLAANNYVSDIVDIGFIGNYVNATGQNVHTGLYREHEDKMYYLFQGYDKEPINNHIGALSNNMTLAVLNADLRTSNLVLGGANAILTIGASFNHANAAHATANAAFARANIANITSDRAWNHANAAFANANTVMVSAQAAFTVANSSFLHANAGYAFANSIAITANLAFVHANAAFSAANVAGDEAESAFLRANLAHAHANAAFAVANTARTETAASFLTANIGYAHANASFARANAALPNTSGAAFAGNLNLPTGNLAVGIASANVGAKLQVYNTTGNSELWITADNGFDPTLRLTGEAGDIVNEGFTLRYDNSVGDVYFENKFNGTAAYHFQTAVVEAFTIQTDGKVGVGTTSPGHILDVKGTANVSSALLVNDMNVKPTITAAFAHANAAFANGNTVIRTAQSAFTVANSGFLHANAAYAFANSVSITANLAFTHANAAFLKANNAQPFNARLADIAALAVTDGNFIVANGTTWIVESDATARTSLGLGTIATQAASSVSITGGSITGITDLAVADGGTGASDAGTARTNLGLAIGTNVQSYSARLAEIAALAVTADNFIVGNGTNWVLETPAAARTSLGLGTIATQAASSVSITGGSITGITDLALADGGTGASDAGTARTNLNVPTRTGGDASGTWGINITGSAGSATTATNSTQLGGVAAANFVQGDGARGRSVSRTGGTANSLTDPSGFYFGSSVTGMPTTDWWTWNQSIGDSWVSPDGYGWQHAVSFWGDDIRIRRLQSGVWQTWTVMLHSGNYNSYAPTLTGTGASGTWGISITGSAAQLGGVAAANYARDDIASVFASTIQTTGLGVGTAPSATTGEIRATNNITAYFSDKRLKTNIKQITFALDKINKISGVTFQSNDEAAKYGYTDTKTQVGVIAQEIEAVLPEVVVPAPFDIAKDDDGNEYSKSGQNYKTVQYEKLVPLLIEAIKELNSQVSDLQNQIQELKK